MDGYVVVTMVHGTFARGAEWTNDDESFAKQRIKAQMGARVVFRAFNWSGSNSHKARIQAGKELAEDQAAVLQQYAGAKRFLLAHSHGGNVAYYALRTMPPEVRPDGIVTMGTPFIHCCQRDVTSVRVLGPWILAFLALSFAPILAALILHYVAFPLSSIVTDIWPGFELPEWVWLIAILIVGGNSLRIPIWAFSQYSILEQWALKKQNEIFSRLSLPVSGVPCMYIHVVGDEARFWLRKLAWVSNTPARLWNRHTMKIVLAAACIGWLIALVFGDGYEYESWSDAVGMGIFGAAFFSVTTLLWLAVYSQILMVLVPMITRAHRGGFGGEGLFCNWLVRIFSESFPPANDEVVAVELRCTSLASVARGLRHSRLYSDPNVLDSIARWIDSKSRVVAEISDRPS